MDRARVLVVGSANMDLVAVAGRFPSPGETVFGKSFDLFPGGKGANQAVCASRLGGDVQFIGKLGRDLFGEKLGRGMKRDGVNLDHCEMHRTASTGTAIITVDGSGQNQIVVISGSNMALRPADIERHRSAFRSTGILLMQLEIPVPTVVRAALLARQNGIPVILNPAPARPLPKGLLKLVDYLVPNETELALISGSPVRSLTQAARCARGLLAQGVGTVVVTLGSKGSLAVTASDARHFPARRVRAVDTTAAGDAFCGALALALSSGRSLSEAIPFASDVAAISVTRRGAQSSMPTQQELQAFIGRRA